VKNTGEVGGDFHLCLKSTFESPIFFSYQVTNPSTSRKKKLVSNFNFIIFLIFLKSINLIQANSHMV
jgi:hypothetical protein